jgi:hypothetical protein
MARPRLDSSAPLETLTVRLPRAYMNALDVFALGISLKTGKRASRSDALRFLMSPVLNVVLHGGKLAKAIAGLAPEARTVAWTAVKATQRLGDSSAPLLDRALGVMDDLGADFAFPPEKTSGRPKAQRGSRKRRPLQLPAPPEPGPEKEGKKG